MKHDLPMRFVNEHLLPASGVLLFRARINQPYELHWHEFYELTFVLSGNGRNIVNGVPHHLHSGDLFLLTPADFHEIHPLPGETLDVFNLIFSEDAISPEVTELLYQHEQQYAICVEEFLFPLYRGEFERILSEVNEPKIGQRMIIKGALERLLIDLLRNCTYKPSSPPTKTSHRPILLRSLTYLQHHFREPITLEQAASFAGFSANYYSELFRRTTGISFQQYLCGLRLQFSRSLLLCSDLPITEICHASGFNTLTHFEKMFKQKFGSAPKALRENNRTIQSNERA